MSNRYKGGVISATPPTTTGGESGTASGAWTLEQQMQLQAAGLWPSQPPLLFIEDVFSTYLYTGNGSTQTITNGINLSGKGGMVWFKNRSNAFPGNIFDTVRNNGYLTTTSTGAVNAAGGGVPPSSGIASFNNNGFTIADGSAYWNSNSQTYVSWTFREQAKFFDVVTWTGNGAYPRTINHNLGSTPGCIIIKSVSDAGYGWITWHRSLGANDALQLQTADAAITDANLWNGTPTSTTFSVGSYSGCNANGVTYVAYLFAHDAGGFGLTETDNVISCGSYTGNGTSSNFVTVGYEPQWVMIKKSSDAESWYMYDNMRGVATLGGGQSDIKLRANSSGVEGSLAGNAIAFNATGFNLETADNELNNSGSTYIYIAIRRGPMKIPTVGTSVFSPQVQTPPGGTYTIAASSGFPIDWLPTRQKGVVTDWYQTSRLTNNYMSPNTSNAEDPNIYGFDLMQGVSASWSANSTVSYAFKRAPGFFDVVAYTGTGVARTVAHNLAAVPELMIVKSRSAGGENWNVYSATLTATKYLTLNLTNAEATDSLRWNDTAPTSSVFSLGTRATVNGSGTTFVAYLFATCAGVSKVGSYTGTGALQTVNCGFTSGARFVLIKRTDSTGDWWVYNSASGITSGNDPYLLMNSTDAEVTGTNYVDTDSTGFKVTAAAPAGLNASGGTYIFLAIA